MVGEPTIHTVNGYIFNRYAKLGVGVGYDSYPDINTVPLYLNIQGDVLKGKITPVYSFGIGYGIAGAKDREFGQISDASGGLFYQPSVGVMFNGISNSFVVALDYKHQVTQLEYNDWWWGGELTETRTFRNLAIKLGLGTVHAKPSATLLRHARRRHRFSWVSSISRRMGLSK